MEKINKSDFINDILNEESKLSEFFNNQIVEDHTIIQRKLVVLNLPAVTIMLFENKTNEELKVNDSIDFYAKYVHPIYDKLSRDTSEEVRGACALILHEMIRLIGDENSIKYLYQPFMRFLEDGNNLVLL